MKTDKITFRNPKRSDAESLFQYVNSLIKERAYILLQKKVSLKEEKEYLKETLKQIKEKDRVFLFIDIDGKVMGNASVSLKDRSARRHVGELAISVSREIRGRGLGKELLKRIIDKAVKELKITMVILYAASENKVAIGLYKKMGFKEAGKIKKEYNHYGKVMDTVLMVKYI